MEREREREGVKGRGIENESKQETENEGVRGRRGERERARDRG